MTATRQDIERWIKEAQQQKATHLVVVVDRYDHENYPVYVLPGEDVKKKCESYLRGENMQGVDEIYSFTGKYSVASQLAEHRARHFD